MANVLLGVTGSVAALKTPELFQALIHAGHSVQVLATQAARYFFDPFDPRLADPEAVGANAPVRFDPPRTVLFDDDEWPGRREGQQYQRDDTVLHIELRRWADVFLLAPLDANTLAKLACGLADNCLTCVWRAWDTTRPVVLAPAMNTLMWEHPLTCRHLRQLAADAGSPAPSDLDQDGLVEWVNGRCPRLRIVGPISKRLACGDVGVGAMAALEQIVAAVNGTVAMGR